MKYVGDFASGGQVKLIGQPSWCLPVQKRTSSAGVGSGIVMCGGTGVPTHSLFMYTISDMVSVVIVVELAVMELQGGGEN